MQKIFKINFVEGTFTKGKQRTEGIEFFLLLKNEEGIQFASSIRFPQIEERGEDITEAVKTFVLKKNKGRLAGTLTFWNGSEKTIANESFSLYVSRKKDGDIGQEFSILCFQFPERVTRDLRWHYFDNDSQDCGLALHLLLFHLLCFEEVGNICEVKN